MQNLNWKVSTKNLLEELQGNKQVQVAAKPLKILYDILRVAAKKAIETGDAEMVSIMWMLTMYEQADMESSDFDEAKDNEMRGIYDKYLAKVVNGSSGKPKR